MQEPRTWRELLGRLIERPEEKRDLSEKADIPQRTLERWAGGGTKEPQHHLLHLLLDALPQHREQLITLLRREFPDFEAPRFSLDETMPSIPTEFYSRVVEAHTTTAAPLHFWTVANLILQQSIGMLDIEKGGVLLTIAQCTAPAPGRPVRSLFARACRGTYPWDANIHQPGTFLGAESLAGYVAASCQSAQIPDVQAQSGRFPLRSIEHEASIVAYPIQLAGRVAGSFVISAARPNFFTPAKIRLGYAFAALLALAFDSEERYNMSEFALGRLPPLAVQRPLLADFARRMIAVQESQHVPLAAAERLVRQHMEDELLALLPDAESEQREREVPHENESK